ncbi:phage head closure protein [Bacillus sp. JJ722]|uniref:phage head closure protein n=1 Tax=Bacillus sp. JJ722 TaxID=3122973 RepID=UPI002FFF99C0
MVFKIPIEIWEMDEDTEVWSLLLKCHAKVNKAKGSEYMGSGAVQSKVETVFEVRYNKLVAAIELSTQLYRVKFNGVFYDVKDYDDYMYLHKTVKLLGAGRRV